MEDIIKIPSRVIPWKQIVLNGSCLTAGALGIGVGTTVAVERSDKNLVLHKLSETTKAKEFYMDEFVESNKTAEFRKDIIKLYDGTICIEAYIRRKNGTSDFTSWTKQRISNKCIARDAQGIQEIIIDL